MYDRLILASASPRRREILTQAGIPFEVQVADFDENEVREELEKANAQAGILDESTASEDYPARYVKALALGKAQAVAAQITDDAKTVVLGADTVVVHRGEILNKPADKEDARRMLAKLQGSTHAVYTGVALCRSTAKTDAGESALCGNVSEPDTADKGAVLANFAVRTEVVFYPMSDAEIEAYLACGEYADKAGAYAIQGKMAAYIREIHGDYYNVVGLPLSAVVQALKKA